MTDDYLTKQCDYVGRQVRSAVRDLSVEAWDSRSNACAMTPRETVTHLCDVYQYATAKAKGGEAKWNQYEAPSDSQVMMEDFDRLRKTAVEACAASGDPYELLTDYIIVHDAYHVGQLCTARIASEPAWDPYSIYS